MSVRPAGTKHLQKTIASAMGPLRHGDIEPPDVETAPRLALTMPTGGAISSETSQAFAEDEYRGGITGVP